MLMIEIRQVTTRRQAWQFTEFPNKLYKKVPAYVPALSIDERHVFNPKTNPVHEYAESIRFLAYDDKGRIVGRIGGIINHRLNDATNMKQARFTRIDMIDDLDVTKALIDAIVKWAKDKGMTTLIGPIGFTDLDRQGMLVEGFDELNMFITIYNHPYYHKHLETLGFVKDADWIEYQITWPVEVPEKVRRGAEISRKRYGFRLVKCQKRKDLYKYAYDAFDVYNDAFKELYGFYPITKAVMDYYIKQMVDIVSLDYIQFVVDKEDKIIGFTVTMPSLALANKKNNGKLLPFGWYRLLRATKKYDVIDLYFIAIDPRHQGKGIIAIMWEDGIQVGIDNKVRFAETGPELENNLNIRAQWKDFETRLHKRRRCYIKNI
ncbi:MAG: GNAT family N-acetyltransferase [Acholeplasmataceae bacterium]|nr:MAG: GNAT family N-acetyltransferase [Acholeplasmataceae bacterium]